MELYFDVPLGRKVLSFRMRYFQCNIKFLQYFVLSLTTIPVSKCWIVCWFLVVVLMASPCLSEL